MTTALLFGGAFNPPTNAHIELADFARRKLGVEKVVFMPTKSVYVENEEGKDFCFSEQKRLEMLLDISKSRPWMEVSSYEIDSASQPRTYFTLKELKRKGYEVKLLIGSDWLKRLQTGWKYVKEICEEFGIVVLNREGDDLKKIIEADPYLSSLMPYLTLLQAPTAYQKTSSSKVRSGIMKGALESGYQKMIPSELKDLGEYTGENKMKNKMIKVACCLNEMKIGNPDFNSRSIINLMKENIDCSLLVFPELSLTGYTCGDLFFQQSLLESSLKGLQDIQEVSASLKGMTFVIGLPLKFKNSLYNCAAFISEGKILGIVPKINIPNYGEFYEVRWFASGKDIKNEQFEIAGEKIPFGTDLLFEDNNSTALVGAEICEDLWVPDKPSTHLALAGANIIVNLSASNETIGKADYRRSLVKMQSATCYAAYLYSSSSTDESSTDLVFSGHLMIANNGHLLKEKIFSESPYVLKTILDLEKNEFNRIHQTTFRSLEASYRHIQAHIAPLGRINDITSDELFSLLQEEKFVVEPYPFVPFKEEDRIKRCHEVIQLQAQGLATRVKNTGIKTLVLGISGGLDSTLALLVAYEAKKLVNDIRIIGLSMPNDGNTSSRTYQNSLELIKSLGLEPRSISIGETVKKHLKDISHPEEYQGEGDQAYENAQARMRTYILMDVANMEKGLVVGTGDLSELALGWCTFNGDHMSMYGVNVGVPKTLVNYLVSTYALETDNQRLKSVLNDILKTPITPELTPNAKGEIAQKTEDKIGKYSLNDFFLYYHLRFGFLPAKIVALARLAFKELTKEEIKEGLVRFYKRFYSQQFKRNCLPDGPKVGNVSLSPRGDYRMPSDSDVRMMIDLTENC